MKINCKAKGSRHATPPGMNENPNVTQLLSEKPAILSISSITIKRPRQENFDVSDCHGGAYTYITDFSRALEVISGETYGCCVDTIPDSCNDTAYDHVWHAESRDL